MKDDKETPPTHTRSLHLHSPLTFFLFGLYTDIIELFGNSSFYGNKSQDFLWMTGGT